MLESPGVSIRVEARSLRAHVQFFVDLAELVWTLVGADAAELLLQWAADASDAAAMQAQGFAVQAPASRKVGPVTMTVGLMSARASATTAAGARARLWAALWAENLDYPLSTEVCFTRNRDDRKAARPHLWMSSNLEDIELTIPDHEMLGALRASIATLASRCGVTASVRP